MSTDHKSKLITSGLDRQIECSCGFRTRVADGFKLCIFDIEDEFRKHLADDEKNLRHENAELREALHDLYDWTDGSPPSLVPRKVELWNQVMARARGLLKIPDVD